MLLFYSNLVCVLHFWWRLKIRGGLWSECLTRELDSSRPDNPEATRLPAKVRNIVNFNEKNMPQIFGVAFVMWSSIFCFFVESAAISRIKISLMFLSNEVVNFMTPCRINFLGCNWCTQNFVSKKFHLTEIELFFLFLLLKILRSLLHYI